MYALTYFYRHICKIQMFLIMLIDRNIRKEQSKVEESKNLQSTLIII